MKITYTKDGINIGDEFISLDEITTNVNKAKIKDSGLVLLTMAWAETRGSDSIAERITIPKKNVERFKEILHGKTIYFGEISGKHSEVFGTLDDDEITVNEDLDDINNFLLENPNGHDFNYSFTDTFCNNAWDGRYIDDDNDGDDVDINNEIEALVKEFQKLY